MIARRCCCLLVLLLVIAGCGGAGKSGKTARVSGTVSVNGAPIEKGTINFISEEKSGGAAGEDSAEIKAGKFTASAVPLGKVRMFVIANKETGKMVPGSSEPVPEVVSIVPPAYAQGIEATINGNESDRKIELLSPP